MANSTRCTRIAGGAVAFMMFIVILRTVSMNNTVASSVTFGGFVSVARGDDDPQVIAERKRTARCPYRLAAGSYLQTPRNVEKHVVPKVTKPKFNTDVEEKSSETPLKIIYMGRDETQPQPLADNIRRTREALPEFRHVYISETGMRSFIRFRYNTTVLDAFDSVRSLELKVELFKWLYLWTEGGIFVHLTATVTSKFREMILKPELREQLVVSHDGSIVAAPAQDPVVMRILTQIWNNLNRRLYTSSLSSIGGAEVILNELRTPFLERSNATGIYVLAMKHHHWCAIRQIRHGGSTIADIGLGYGEYLDTFKPEEDIVMWSERKLYHQDFATDKERSPEELEARTRCPFGQTEIISYNPVDTKASDRTTFKIAENEPASSPMPEHTQRIPKRMMQTNKDSMVPEGMFEAVKALRALHPDYEHFYYSDTTARQFLIENTNDTFVEVFDTLVPGAYKADFFRYVWLYLHGGVYVDIDEVPLERIQLTPEDAFVSALDIPPNAVYNAFMAVTPYHPVIDTVIRAIVHKVIHRNKCTDPLTYTGPIALGVAFRIALGISTDLVADKEYGKGVRLIRYEKGHLCSIGYLVSEKRRLMVTRYPTYKRDMKWYGRHGGEHYWDQCRSQKHLTALPVTVNHQDGATAEEINAKREALLMKRVCASQKKISDYLTEEKLPAAKISRVPYGPGELSKAQPKDTSGTSRFFFVGKTDELPSGFIDSIESFRRVHPNAGIEYYNETTAKQYIGFHMSTKLVALYEKLTVWEDKAQFFALISLLSRGGTYVRLGVTALAPLDGVGGEAVFVEESSGGQKISMDIVSCRMIFSVVGAAMQHRIKTALQKDVPSISECISEAIRKRAPKGETNPIGGGKELAIGGVVKIMWKRPSAPKCPDNEIGFDDPSDYGMGSGLFRDTTPTLRQDVLALPKVWNEDPQKVFLRDSSLGALYFSLTGRANGD